MCWVCLNIRNWILPCLHDMTDGYIEGCTVKQYQNACKNKRRLTSGDVIKGMLLNIACVSHLDRDRDSAVDQISRSLALNG